MILVIRVIKLTLVEEPLLLGDFMNAYSLYEDIADLTALRTHIEKQMDEYNSSPGVVRLDLVLFRDAVEHVCRIVRVVSQPRGNVLLVGVGMQLFLVQQ